MTIRVSEITKQKESLEKKHESLLEELQSYWKEWDAVIDKGSLETGAERSHITAKMVDVLNRRNYIRNLVRDVNAALEE